MGDVFLDALLDTLKVLPFLLVMNFIIELIEYSSKGLKADGILKGGAAPLLGTLVGVVPQCGFSVVATELYSKRKIALGTLLAVYLATSDEALPIMLSSREGIEKILPILIVKICFSIVVGYAVFVVEKIIGRKFANSAPKDIEKEVADRHEHGSADGEARDEKAELSDKIEFEKPREHDECADEHIHIHGCHSHSFTETAPLPDETKRQKAARIFSVYFKHPLLHTATVTLYILIVNIVFGIIVYYIGEERIARFIGSTGYFQPILAGLVGLIPNCAASVVITELYIVGGLNLGGAAAGLLVSAGIGYAVLVKQNRPIKNTVLIIVVMYVLSVTLGICVTAFGG